MKTSLTVLALVFMTACSKSTGDSMRPVIEMQAPTVRTTDTGAKLIVVNATISDDDELHEVHLDVTDKSSGEVMHYHYHPDATSFTINEMVPALSGSAYQVKVEADDHSGNKTEKEMDITIP